MESNCIVYSSGCAKCVVLEELFRQRRIKFDIVSDIKILEGKGFKQFPMVEVDGELMDFGVAFKWGYKQ